MGKAAVLRRSSFFLWKLHWMNVCFFFCRDMIWWQEKIQCVTGTVWKIEKRRQYDFIYSGTVAELTENSVITGQLYGFWGKYDRECAQLHIGQEVKLHTYFQVREDAMVLFGFFRKDDLQMFKLLLEWNGWDPRLLLGFWIGDYCRMRLRFAVLSDDVKTLSGHLESGKRRLRSWSRG